jgi:peptidoglycan/xylan/chitin deacetylase (PgdA/CDA1 family)
MENQNKNRYASLSLDLDNLWAYVKVYGDPQWKNYPTYFPTFIPLILDFLDKYNLKITFFVVGQDAEREESKIWIEKIGLRGHEFGNHSFDHEPWMEERSTEELIQELLRTHQAIQKTTGKTPVGFRGPGFCCSNTLLEAVSKLGYRFDTSLFPTLITPLARFYYFMIAGSVNRGDKSKSKNLFGKMSNGFKSIKPFHWKLKSGSLLEIPVTTMPIFRLPFHLSYVMWLSKFSKRGAVFYFTSALKLCKKLNVEPSILLHPLDFLGKEDVPELSFFPGMDLSREHKLEVAHRVMESLKKEFDVIPMSRHAAEIQKRM